MYQEFWARSLVKAVAWRAVATLTTIGIVFVFTNKIELALAIGGVEAFSKVIIFFIHERLWDRIQAGKGSIEPVVFWFTGLSGGGKTTIAKEVCKELRKRKLRVEHLDGDTVRDIFPDTGFSRSERETHIRRIGYLASRLENNGVFVAASFISPYEESRRFVRGLCKNFIEIYVSTSLEECERRDTKGLYRKVREGKIKNFTGIDDPYEKPQDPEMIIDTGCTSLDGAVKQVVSCLGRNYMKRSKKRGFFGFIKEQEFFDLQREKI